MPFSSVSAAHPKRHFENLSRSVKFDFDMGQLIPIECREMIPGDKFVINSQSAIRFQPLVAPVLHEINAYTHWFFVPYRLLWENWTNFITGGQDGNDATPMPHITTTKTYEAANENPFLHTLVDYFGFPLDNELVSSSSGYVYKALALQYLNPFPIRAYNLVWNEFYRDENLQDPVELDSLDILNRNWKKDYFTSSLPWQQRGNPPAIPLSGTAPVSVDVDLSDEIVFPSASVYGQSNLVVDLNNGNSGVINTKVASGYPNMKFSNPKDAEAQVKAVSGSLRVNNGPDNISASGEVDLSQATATFTPSDLRLAFALQRWQERNARAGVRYTEFLHAQYGTSPKDETLQRPEYIGGTKSPVIVSEIVQSSASTETSKQGNMAGHGLSASISSVGTYYAREFGCVIGLASVMPEIGYCSQGLPREWSRLSRFDYYAPAFAYLSEQPVFTSELYFDPLAENQEEVFGYQAHWNELRTGLDQVMGIFRYGVTEQGFDYWHLNRKFGSKPLLDSDFVQCNPSKRIFAVPNQPGLLATFENSIHAFRPMPRYGEPGLIDHSYGG